MGHICIGLHGQSSGSLMFCLFLQRKQSHVTYVTADSGKGFTRKPPVEKTRCQLELEPIEIKPKYFRQSCRGLDCQDIEQNPSEEIWIGPTS